MSPQQRLSFIQQCIELGVTSFDHADIYGNYAVEQLFGEALALEPGLRHKIELISKCGIKLLSPARPAHTIKHYDTSRQHLVASVETSLCALASDHLDLLLIHRPDPLMNFDEIAETFRQLQDSGKVAHFGVSNFSTTAFQALHRRFPLSTNQIELSPLHLAPIYDGSLDALQDAEISPMIWSPLAGGRIFSNPDTAIQALEQKLVHIAARHACSTATLIYAWIMRLPCHPIPLTGTKRIDAVGEAVAACSLQLDRQEWFEILQAATGIEVA